MKHYRTVLMILYATLVSEVLAEPEYPFEKIFTVNNQRYQIDKLRLQSDELEKPSKSSSDKNPVEQLSKTQRVRFSGYLLREGGSEVYWLDGKTVLGETALDVSVERDQGNKHFIFKTSDDQTILKPGQVWVVDKSKIVENYEVEVNAVDLLKVEAKKTKGQKTKGQKTKAQKIKALKIKAQKIKATSEYDTAKE